MARIIAFLLIDWVKHWKYHTYFTKNLKILHDMLQIFLKPVWVGNVYWVGVYATHSTRILGSCTLDSGINTGLHLLNLEKFCRKKVKKW